MIVAIYRFLKADSLRIFCSSLFMSFWSTLERFEGFAILDALLSPKILWNIGFWVPIVALVRLVWFSQSRPRNTVFEDAYRAFVRETRIFNRGK